LARFRHQDRHQDIQQYGRSDSRKDGNQKDHTHNRRIDAEVFGNTSQNTADLSVCSRFG